MSGPHLSGSLLIWTQCEDTDAKCGAYATNNWTEPGLSWSVTSPSHTMLGPNLWTEAESFKCYCRWINWRAGPAIGGPVECFVGGVAEQCTTVSDPMLCKVVFVRDLNAITVIQWSNKTLVIESESCLCRETHWPQGCQSRSHLRPALAVLYQRVPQHWRLVIYRVLQHKWDSHWREKDRDSRHSIEIRFYFSSKIKTHFSLIKVRWSCYAGEPLSTQWSGT